jgi:SOS-response transcriptional repressor LexA
MLTWKLVLAQVLFALRVRGDRQAREGIQPGVLIIVRQQRSALNGDLAAAPLGRDDARWEPGRSAGPTG